MRFLRGFPGGPVAATLYCHSGDTTSIPGLGSSRLLRSISARVSRPLSQHLEPEGHSCGGPHPKSLRSERPAHATKGSQVTATKTRPSRNNDQLSSVQALSRVRLFATPWTTARQASLSITNSRSLLKLMSIESVMPSDISQHQGLFQWVSSLHQVAIVTNK